MNEPLPILVENSIQIAWDYLERTGELGDPEVASRVLFDAVEIMVLRESAASCCSPTRQSMPTCASRPSAACLWYHKEPAVLRRVQQ